MRAMHFHHIEARIEGECRGAPKIPNRALDLRERHGTRRRIVSKGERAGPESLPSPFGERERLTPEPGLVHRGLTPRVRELYRGYRPARAEELCEGAPGGGVRFWPDGCIPRRDAPVR